MPGTVKTYGKTAKTTLILAHGAGAGMESDFMIYFAETLSAQDIQVILFDFPYMTKRQEDGKKRPPDRAPKLIAHYRELIEKFRADGPLFIGGKSMGGRIASMLLAEENTLADGLVLLGYPFTPPGKPENLRTEHFSNIKKPTLIVQGERDTFGGRNFCEWFISTLKHEYYLDTGWRS